MKKVIWCGNAIHTIDLIKKFIDSGYESYVLAPAAPYSIKLSKMGCHFLPIKMDNASSSPTKDIHLLYQLFSHYRRIKPNIVFNYTVKPYIYSTMVAKFLNIPVVNFVTRGNIFTRNTLSDKLVKVLYKFALNKANLILFRNPEDKALFIDQKIVKKPPNELIEHNTGVDTIKFKQQEYYGKNNPFRFLFVGRLIPDKGIFEYLQASQDLSKKYNNISFEICGKIFEQNDCQNTKRKFDIFFNNQQIKYHGFVNNVQSYINKADCIVIPSHPTGTPKSLLESLACGKPIITTNTPWCKQSVVGEQNGFLVEAKSSQSLAEAMEKMFHLESEVLREMGKISRKLAEDKFDLELITGKFLRVVQTYSN